MSKLIPKKRVNKNGIVVTKHVRADKQGVNATVLPVPSVVSTVRPATPLLSRSLNIQEMKQNRRGIIFKRSLSDLSPEATQKLDELMRAEKEMFPRSYVISEAVDIAMEDNKQERWVRRLHNISTFGDIFLGANDDGSMDGLINSLDKYPESVLPRDQDYFLHADDELVERARTVLAFTLQASERRLNHILYKTLNHGNENQEYTVIKSESLICYVADNPAESAAILDVLEQEGKMLPVEVIKGRLTHEVQAVRDGFL